MSDEGLMTEEIEDGLSVVIAAVTTCDFPAEEVLAWCSAMLDADRVGFIARKPLEALRRRVQAAKALRGERVIRELEVEQEHLEVGAGPERVEPGVGLEGVKGSVAQGDGPAQRRHGAVGLRPALPGPGQGDEPRLGASQVVQAPVPRDHPPEQVAGPRQLAQRLGRPAQVLINRPRPEIVVGQVRLVGDEVGVVGDEPLQARPRPCQRSDHLVPPARPGLGRAQDVVTLRDRALVTGAVIDSGPTKGSGIMGSSHRHGVAP